ncbi:MAG: DUF4127 family protein [Oscillospiraceae bacterium]|nr:DUF4127 family protein [Oscillospiraceae bacterium]
MKKILVIPLDERPCNYDFPKLMARDSGYEVILPPRDILGRKKAPGNVDTIWNWFVENVKTCSDAVISIDCLLFSGIVPSRLHNEKVEALIEKLNKLRDIKNENPSLNIYAFNLIMRNPTYSSDDEEPDYYGKWGAEIHRWGYIRHKKEIGIATKDEEKELKDIKKRLPRKYLTDYLDRRAVNIEVNKEFANLVADGVFAFALYPQDDSSPYGLTAKDQQIVREKIKQLDIETKVYMYPEADAAVNTLLIRAINNRENRRPLVFPKYASSMGSMVIPLFEDRIVGETIKYQILAAGGLVATSASEADIVLLINIPSGNMLDRYEVYEMKSDLPSLEYDANRNLIELIEYAAYVIETLGKSVVFADIAYCNGGDPLLLRLLRQKGLLFKLAGYAGWNTSSNSLGTCIPMGMLYNITGETNAHKDFLALRYVEDIGYDSGVRHEVSENVLHQYELDYTELDGQHGRIAGVIREKLQDFADEYLSSDKGHVVVKDCYMPWNRMFEVGLDVEYKSL